MKKFHLNLALLGICLFFLFTRLWQISSVPSSVYWDEASIGYNAFSILKTGTDEWGVNFPLHFRAFGEFKLPVYIYTVTIFEALLGLNELAVRLPAVLFSLGSLIFVYLLTKTITQKQQTALIASLLFATCPWFFIFSRTGYEATAGLFFYLFGLWLFLKKDKFYFLASAMSFALSMYSYNSFRVITPLTIFLLLFYLGKQKKSIFLNKFLIIGLLILFISAIPIVRFSLSGGNTRFDQVSVFKTENPFLRVTTNYFSHFGPSFLLLNGDSNLRSEQDGFGEITLIEFLLGLLGLATIFKTKRGFFLLWLILIAPIPAAITTESPHALRSLALAPFLAILGALGFEYLDLVSNFRKISLLVVLLIFVLFSWYFYSFLNIYPKNSKTEWQFPYKVINTQYMPQINKAQNVYISPKLSQPYIFTLFYQKYDPVLFRQQVKYNSPDQWGVSLVNSFGKYHFEDVDDLSKIPANSVVFSLANDTMNEVTIRFK